MFYRKRFVVWSCVTAVREVFKDGNAFPSGSCPDAGGVDEPFKPGCADTEARRAHMLKVNSLWPGIVFTVLTDLPSVSASV